jgi:hypothetical protein
MYNFSEVFNIHYDWSEALTEATNIHVLPIIPVYDSQFVL